MQLQIKHHMHHHESKGPMEKITKDFQFIIDNDIFDNFAYRLKVELHFPIFTFSKNFPPKPLIYNNNNNNNHHHHHLG